LHVFDFNSPKVWSPISTFGSSKLKSPASGEKKTVEDKFDRDDPSDDKETSLESF
jgi:hypothetical protein